MIISDASLFLLAIVAAAIISAGLTAAIRPLLLKHALAKPNARSSHRIPTPQGAGIAVIAATLLVTAAIMADASRVNIPVAVFGATLFIAIVGFADDLKSIPVLTRLLLQAVAVGAIVFAAPDDVRIVSACPLWLERSLVLLAGLWFVNLVNFMDGLDWMTVAEVVPVTAALVVLGSLGEFPLSPVLVAATLCGAMIGFAPFNRPVAKIFLGDVGSLPIGLLLGWLLVLLAGDANLAAAVLLPLYYLADATITLIRRMLSGERIWQAHRTHFYQLATARGFTVTEVVVRVFVVNVCLGALAVATALVPGRLSDVGALLGGALLVAGLLVTFARGRK